MLITIYPSNDPLAGESAYHVNPYNIVGVHEHKGAYSMDTADGCVRRIDRESYVRIVIWMEQVR